MTLSKSRVAVLVGAFTALAAGPLPMNWGAGGRNSTDFEMGTDAAEKFEGKPVVVIRSGPKSAADGDGNLSTAFRAGNYRGKRLRFTAWLKTESVTLGSGLFLRVNGDLKDNAWPRLVNANTRYQPLKGTTKWALFKIVAEIPVDANHVTIGAYQEGLGTTWMTAPSVEIVGTEVPLTPQQLPLPEAPQLDLSKQ